ncbi:IclR family transcriptional regulator [Pengzhenrongella sp.]|uniref:IclR family transcriptional regulator n=1 Tax=Pengzhenrongella sp. TaxID=2888820 RepID=UPI002F940F51
MADPVAETDETDVRDAPDDTGVKEVKSAARTMDVLEFLASRSGEPSRLREIATALAAPRSSTYALLRTLVSREWVRTDISGNFYSLGLRALLVGTSYLDADAYVRVVRPVLAQVTESLDETMHLARLDGTDVVYLATQESHQYLRANSRVGRRLPAHATSLGKAILAERDEAAVPDELAALTARTITDRGALLTDLATVRMRGYAIDDEENTMGLRCFGFALHYTDPVSDAFSCSVPLARLTPERERQIVETMQAARRQIEALAPPRGRF